MKRIMFAASALALAACSTHVQSSSGRDYLSKAPAPVRVASLAGEGAGDAQLGAIRAAASVEPLLRFPAKIGVARIEDGALTPIPDAEMAAFAGALEATGGAYGDFVPLNLLVTAMAVPEDQLGALSGGRGGAPLLRARQAVDAIRIGAARQHMDAVMVYEVFGTSDARQSALSVGDLTILGAFLLPGREVDAMGHAEGLLIDVRNAYPYLTASETVTRDGMAATARSRKRGDELKAAAQLAAVEDMAATLPAAFAKLAVELGNLPDERVAAAE